MSDKRECPVCGASTSALERGEGCPNGCDSVRGRVEAEVRQGLEDHLALNALLARAEKVGVTIDPAALREAFEKSAQPMMVLTNSLPTVTSDPVALALAQDRLREYEGAEQEWAAENVRLTDVCAHNWHEINRLNSDVARVRRARVLADQALARVQEERVAHANVSMTDEAKAVLNQRNLGLVVDVDGEGELCLRLLIGRA
jgi:hypothetical protein